MFSISTKSVAEPVLPRAAFDICCAAFAILKARFRHIKTLVTIYKKNFVKSTSMNKVTQHVYKKFKRESALRN